MASTWEDEHERHPFIDRMSEPLKAPSSSPTPSSSAGHSPTPAFVRASVAWHAGAALAAAVQPALWPWSLGAVVLNHAALTAIGLWPRSTWLGTNLTRLPAAAAARHQFAITIDDGPDPAVTPAVLDILDAHDARATFFCIATRAQAHPALCREIVARGHSVQNHSHHHVHTFSLLGRTGFAREIGSAQRALADITGVEPRFFRAPAGLRNPLLDGVLHRLDLTLVSWTRRGFDTRRGDAARVLASLTRDLQAGDIVLLHDGNAARTPEGRAVVLDALPVLLDRLDAERLTAVTLPQAMAWAAASAPLIARA